MLPPLSTHSPEGFTLWHMVFGMGSVGVITMLVTKFWEAIAELVIKIWFKALGKEWKKVEAVVQAPLNGSGNGSKPMNQAQFINWMQDTMREDYQWKRQHAERDDELFGDIKSSLTDGAKTMAEHTKAIADLRGSLDTAIKFMTKGN